MKIGITSASGQLGSSIVRELKRVIGSDRIIGIVRTPAKAAHLGIEIRKGDYTNREEYNDALKGIDSLLLISGMDKPEKRIQQHRNVIEAAKQNGVRKIVYTSIIGNEDETSFSPIVQSNRATEKDIKDSGLHWVIGRNGIYIEPDLEYMDSYINDGEIRNCAADGKCAYTSREELAVAYAQLLLNDKHNGHTFNLVGESLTQTQIADFMNLVFHTNLKFSSVSVDIYKEERKAALGDFLGSVIAGIYDGIRSGFYDVPSDFEKAAGRPHKSMVEMMKAFKMK